MSSSPRWVFTPCLAVLLATPALLLAQPATMPDNATRVPPDMGVLPVRPATPVPRPEALQPRLRPELKPRPKPKELKPDLRSEPRPQMRPGLQPNSQQALRTGAPTDTRRSGVDKP